MIKLVLVGIISMGLALNVLDTEACAPMKKDPKTGKWVVDKTAQVHWDPNGPRPKCGPVTGLSGKIDKKPVGKPEKASTPQRSAR